MEEIMWDVLFVFVFNVENQVIDSWQALIKVLF